MPDNEEKLNRARRRESIAEWILILIICALITLAGLSANL